MTALARLKAILFALPILAHLGAGPTHAQGFGESDYAKAGVYAGIGGVLAVPGSGSEDGGPSVWIGYRALPLLAFETQLDYLADVDVYIWTNHVRLYMGNAWIQPYMFGGVGMAISGSNTGTTLRVGGGIEMHVTEHFSVVGGPNYVYVYHLEGSDSEDYLSVNAGIQYRF